MILIRKSRLQPKIRGIITEIQKSQYWKNIKVDDTKAIRRYFDDEFPKETIRPLLIRDQHGLCAYCMRRIYNNANTSIEHIIPLKENKEKALDYNNLIAVCDGGKRNNTNGVLCCESAKGDAELYVNPMDKNHIDSLKYNNDGTIGVKPSKERIRNDIENVLKLNGIKQLDGSIKDTNTGLVKGRKDAMTVSRQLVSHLDKMGKCSSANIRKLIEKYLDKEEYVEYIGVYLYYFKMKSDSLQRRGL